MNFQPITNSQIQGILDVIPQADSTTPVHTLTDQQLNRFAGEIIEVCADQCLNMALDSIKAIEAKATTTQLGEVKPSASALLATTLIPKTLSTVAVNLRNMKPIDVE